VTQGETPPTDQTSSKVLPWPPGEQRDGGLRATEPGDTETAAVLEFLGRLAHRCLERLMVVKPA
jgi:hypothetical protein